MVISYSRRKRFHADCGGEVEEIAVSDRVGVQMKCKKCGECSYQEMSDFAQKIAESAQDRMYNKPPLL